MADDNLLGRFIREHREAVTPDSVGLPRGGRRRTPGLRRAELATLAGISIDYLTRLEQGKDRHPSPQVLNAIAETLRLDADEQHLLQKIGAVTASSELCPGIEPPATEVQPGLAAILDRLEPTPAFVRNRRTDVLAHTQGWARVVEAIGLLDADPPNLARHLFTDARAREVYPSWSDLADDMAALLRSRNRSDDDGFRQFVDSLGAELPPGLRERLLAGPAVAPRTGVHRLVHPLAGDLHITPEVLDDGKSEQQLVVYLPADEATAEGLDRLIARRPGALHVVSG
jgi:transcriptional regulator with XRE-family HTH domain